MINIGLWTIFAFVAVTMLICAAAAKFLGEASANSANRRKLNNDHKTTENLKDRFN